MDKKRIFITGATSGIGKALCQKYVDRGEQVIACGRDAHKLQVFSGQVQSCLFDLTNKEQIEKACLDVDKLDLVILNAGDCLYIDNVMDFDESCFEKIIQTNLISVAYLLKQLLKKINAGGRIVFISSSATIIPFPRSEAYGASKAGMDYLANSLRLDLKKHNIKVTLVHPGFIKTPLTDKNDFAMPFILSSEEAAQRIIKGIDRGKDYLHFPKRLTLLLKLFSLLPKRLWQKMIVKEG